LLKVDEGILIPKLMLDFVSGNELARAADEKSQELERLRLKMKLCLAPTKVACASVQFERTEPDGAILNLSP
jgi:hypothetical protein